MNTTKLNNAKVGAALLTTALVPGVALACLEEENHPGYDDSCEKYGYWSCPDTGSVEADYTTCKEANGGGDWTSNSYNVNNGEEYECSRSVFSGCTGTVTAMIMRNICVTDGASGCC